MPTCSGILSKFVLDLRHEDLSPEVCRRAKMMVLDGLGLILSGHNTEHGNIMNSFIASMGYRPEATVLGYGSKTDCMSAALVNGILAYTHDYSDTLLQCVVHGEPVLIPAVLALGEKRRVDGKSLITAVVAGYEIMGRIGMAVNSGKNRMAQQEMGFHPTATCGVFGSAAVAGKLLGFSVEQLADAFGIAGSYASGILEALTSTPVTMARRLSGGKSASSGILSALLAENGFTGPKTVFEGKNGFLSAFTNGKFDVSYLERPTPDRFFIADAAIKYRNCIHAAASPIDGLLLIMEENRLRPEEIKKIKARVPTAHYNIFTAKKDMHRPLTYGDAQTSLPYCLAVASIDGEVSVDQFSEEKIRDKQILEMAEKISLFPDEGMDAGFMAGKWPASIEVTTHDGRAFAETVAYPYGAPENFLDFAALEVKFRNLSKRTLSPDQQDKLCEIVEDLESLGDTSQLVSVVHP